MTQHDEGHDEGQGVEDDPRDARWIERARADFNPPPPPPVGEMWAAIEAEIGRDAPAAKDPDPSDVSREGRPELVLLPEDPAVAGNGRTVAEDGSAGGLSAAGRPGGKVRRGAQVRRGLHRTWGWAAAAVLLLTSGVIMGRWSMQGGPDSPGEVASAPGVTAPSGTAGGSAREGVPSPALARITREHLDRSEAFLVGLRADAGRGTLDPGITAWAETLLSETRLLLDSRAGADGSVAPLLRDLEWILVQVAALPVGGERRNEELRLLNDGIDEQDVLFRMRAVEPLPGMAGAME
jgi:hypothetical protein